MKKFMIGAVLSASMLVSGLAATPAMAQDYGRYHSYEDRGYDGYEQGYRDDGYRGEYRDRRGYNRRDRQYRGDRRCSGTGGAIIGGVLGALLGGEIGRGGYHNRRSGTGTILGAGAGALLGREIDRGDCRR